MKICNFVLTGGILCVKLVSKGAIAMNTYMEKINELRAAIDFEINENEELNLSSPELIKKALLIEEEMSLAN